MAVNSLITHGFHHSEMLEIIVRLEQCVSCEELHENAADTPYIAGIRPTQSKDDLRCSVVARRDHRRMIFVLECSGAEVYQSNLGVKENPPLGGLATDCSG